MGILSVVKEDVEQLVKYGLNDMEIEKSVGIELSSIGYLIKYFRENVVDSDKNINTKVTTNRG